MERFPLSTERPRLRPFRPEDAEFVLEPRQSPALRRFIPSQALDDPAGACAHLARFGERDADPVLADAHGGGHARVLAVTGPDDHGSQAVCTQLGMLALGPTRDYYDTETCLFVSHA